MSDTQQPQKGAIHTPHLNWSWVHGVAPISSPALIFGPGKEIFRIQQDGRVLLAEGAHLDDAARAFWAAVDHFRPMTLATVKPGGQVQVRPARTLYIDLDGVMADFDGAFPAVFGLDHRSLADEEMWGHINSHASFFRDLPPMAGAIDFFRSVEHLQPVILTACPKSNYAHVASQKRAWVRQHLSQTCLVLPVLGGRHKPLFMHQPGDILIDDWGKNCAAWADAGGVAIKHEGDWEETRTALQGTGVLRG